MTKVTKTATNSEKSSRVIKETTREEFTKVLDEIFALVNGENFVDNICDKTDNGKYKITDSKPVDMFGVKEFEVKGVKWYLVPTTDFAVACFSYIRYCMSNDKKSRQAALKELAKLSTDDLLALIANK